MSMNARHAREPQHRATSVEKPELLDASQFRSRVDNVARAVIVLAGPSVVFQSLLVPALSSELDRQEESMNEARAASYSDSQVAIIPYGLEDEDAEKYAELIEEKFNEVGDDLITIETTIVEPSTVALDAYESLTVEDGCIDRGDFEMWGSTVAINAMPELSKYDKVLAVNALAECSGEAIGVARMDSRHSEVFDIVPGWDAFEDNGYSQLVPLNSKVDENGAVVSTSYTYMYSPVNTAVHELLHTFNLGHSAHLNDLEGSAPGVDDRLFSFEASSELVKESRDVNKDVESKTYAEYGGSGLMRYGNYPMADELSTVERYILERPLRATDEDYLIQPIYTSENTPAEISASEADSKIIIHTLTTPLHIPNGPDITSVAIYASVDQKEMGCRIRAAAVYLLTDGNDQIIYDYAQNLEDSDTEFKLVFSETDTLNLTVNYSNNYISVQTEGDEK